VTHRTLGIDSKIFMTPLYSPASKRHCITFLVVDFIGWRERSMRGGGDGSEVNRKRKRSGEKRWGEKGGKKERGEEEWWKGGKGREGLEERREK
jgi:hypothetical protein